MVRCVYGPVYRKSLASEVDSLEDGYIFNTARERWAAPSHYREMLPTEI